MLPKLKAIAKATVAVVTAVEAIQRAVKAFK